MNAKTETDDKPIDVSGGMLPDGQTADLIRDDAGRLKVCVLTAPNITSRIASTSRAARLFRRRSIPLFKMP